MPSAAPIRRAAAAVLVVVAALVCAACEKTTHANIDKWMSSKKGPAKLRAALGDSGLDADLSAHAAENLLRRGEDQDVRKGLDKLSDQRRTAVIAKLAPRLWRMARLEGEMSQPTSLQELAKDTLFDIREAADSTTRDEIDGYLTDWLTGGYYERRAITGRHPGATIIRVLGPEAGNRLIAEANRIIAAPDHDGRRLKIGDELLLGLAVSGSPDAVKLVLDIFAMDRGDATLPGRAMTALYKAYLDTTQPFQLADPAGLVPALPRLVTIAEDDSRTAQIANDAVQLIRATGMPHCLEPLLGMVGHPHNDPRFLWVAANNALRCGGATALTRVAEALPTGRPYERDVLGGATWQTLSTLGQRDALIEAARPLLTSKSWVARWVGIESLAELSSRADADRIAELGRDRARLTGYWGDQSELPRGDRKREPTLGERAAEIAQALR